MNKKIIKIKKSAEFIGADKEPGFRNKEEDPCEEELIIVKEELAIKKVEKEKRAAELNLAKKELAFQKEEKKKRAAELVIANRELKKAEKKIIAIEKKFRYALGNMLEGVQILDFHWRYIYVNDALVKSSKYSREELLGHTMMEKYPGIEQTDLFKVLQRCMTERVAKHFETEFVFPDGSKTDFELSIQPTLEGIFILSMDIDERKRNHDKLVQSEEKYHSIFLKSPLPKWIYDSETLRLLDVNEAAIRHYGYTQEEFMCMTIQDIRYKEDMGLLFRDLKEIQEDPVSRQANWRHKKKNGEIITVETTVHPIDYDNRKAKMVVINDITEKIAAEQELRTTEERLFFHIENSPLGFIEWDDQIRPRSWSKRAEEIFGWTEQEILSGQVDWFTRVYEEDQRWVSEISKQLVSGKIEKNQLQHRNYTRDGRVIWCEWFNSVLKDKHGKVISILSLVQDITENKKVEEDLRQSELSLNEAQAISHIGNWEIDFTRKIQIWSDEFYNIYGISKEEVQPSTELFLSFVHPEDAGFARKKVQEAFDSLKDSSFNFRFIRKDGVTRYGYTDWRFEFDKKGNLVRLFGILQDITERKEAEEELRKINERYEFVNKATRDIIWEWDYRTHKGKWGEGFVTMFGYSEDKLIYDETWVEEYVHPDDKKRLLKYIHDRMENSLQNSQNEYRFRCADGSYKYVFDRGYILYDKNKKPYRMIGAMTDVTENKRLQRELAAQEIKQQKLITETIIQTQEKERDELGRELHDNINQILATVKMYLGLAKAKENVSVDLVGHSYEYVTEAMEEIRKLSHSLVAPSLGGIGLKEALQGLVEDTNLINGLRVQLLFDERYKEKDIDKNKELMLYRIVQEQMSNVTKYARAHKAVITLKTGNGNLLLSVADDGVGFDVRQRSKGIGLKNMKSRVEFHSGNMNIISAPGKGCKLEFFIPV